MATTMIEYYRSTVTSVGADAQEMVDGGVVIFFGDPCPAELAEISVVHAAAHLHPQREPSIGDTLRVGEVAVTITAVGEIAGSNLRTLGHIVVYCDPDPDQKLLPGALHAAGALPLPAPGDTIRLIGGS